MRKFLPLLLLITFAVVAQLISHFKPVSAKRELPPTPVISVETLTIQPHEYTLVINSFGRVRPRTEGELVAQVSGQIIEVSPNFRDGGFFEAGEVLLTIDPRDYNIQVDIAAAELANAKVNLEEQQALADQAKKDRAILNRKGLASDYALRKPQLAAAQSQIDAARAKLAQARLAVERTRIKAPYAGRILSRSVDQGVVVSNNQSLARIYATDRVEVRLPLKNSELSFIDLPEQFRNESDQSATVTPVRILNNLGNTSEEWPAELVRTAGAIDEQSQQLYVTAQIDDPYAVNRQGLRPLKIGQFVTAEIQGKKLPDAITIPNAAIYQGSYVYLFRQGLLQRADIRVAWQNGSEALISEGLKPGDQLVLTPLGQVSSGTPVKRLGQEKGGRGKNVASQQMNSDHDTPIGKSN
ncbi:efflux RND transporter periplasmic adaptor subunit [Sedimenticola selenatireducens]|uniref:Efflux RND transporter periplasmic adaptor subunit n=1 Tax=Sedimenticola selenatireducens TaxID=191960 RepID=A0A558DVP6_9GAMM|nr:efflux RND transporter periplasmic adaptor subunit [Sedimenticola selenatireducens]TVO77795.1 efflux RND transporter periplasmic adaptor subunit [Sedimenticola selenatireducens]TVT65100.1 MAG: efflux RND transporter periplasmic adaptor subunit [Sedimenticola selenatireducens]